MRPKAKSRRTSPLRKILRDMPRDLQQLLIGGDFHSLGRLVRARFCRALHCQSPDDEVGMDRARGAPKPRACCSRSMAITALATYIPIAKWVDRSPSPRPFIGTTFFLFAIFPICLVLLPRLCEWLGLPVMIGLVLTFVINGLRELGEPARKALISTRISAGNSRPGGRSLLGPALVRVLSCPARRRLALDADRARRDVPHRRHHRADRDGVVLNQRARRIRH